MSNQNQHKPGYKHTPLGWIPEEWEVKKIKDFGKVVTGNTPPTSDLLNYGDDYIFVGPGDVGRDKYINKGEKSISKKGFELSRKLPTGSVLFICIGSTIGKVGIVTSNSTCNQQINAVICNGNGSNEFLYYELLRLAPKIKLIAGEQAVPIINKSQFENSHVAFPIIPEQNKIAAILSAWDEAITKAHQLIAQLQQRNKGLMQQLLTGKKRLKGFEEEWKPVLLSECLSYTPREVVKPSTSFFALGIRSHGKGIFHKNDFEPEDLAMDVLYEVKENDLIVNITFAWEQAIAIAGKDDDGGLVSHRFPTYTFKTEKAISNFFKFLIIQKNFKYMLDLISPGGAGRNRVMSKKDFLKLEILLPDIQEQRAIADILNNAAKELKLQEQRLSALQQQKKGLMQKLLTGEVRVNV